MSPSLLKKNSSSHYRITDVVNNVDLLTLGTITSSHYIHFCLQKAIRQVVQLQPVAFQDMGCGSSCLVPCACNVQCNQNGTHWVNPPAAYTDRTEALRAWVNVIWPATYQWLDSGHILESYSYSGLYSVWQTDYITLCGFGEMTPPKLVSIVTLEWGNLSVVLYLCMWSFPTCVFSILFQCIHSLSWDQKTVMLP